MITYNLCGAYSSMGVVCFVSDLRITFLDLFKNMTPIPKRVKTPKKNQQY